MSAPLGREHRHHAVRAETMAESFSARRPARRMPLAARRRLRADLTQMLFAFAGLALGLALAQVGTGPMVQQSRLAEPLVTLGIGMIGVVSIVYSLLFGVVQWSASSFTPRLNIFRNDPLVWRTFAVTIGLFVFCVTAALANGSAERVSVLVPGTAALAALTVIGLLRKLQTRAYLSLQLASVLETITSSGRARQSSEREREHRPPEPPQPHGGRLDRVSESADSP